jgi:mono/diheme cytochrome c family protein
MSHVQAMRAVAFVAVSGTIAAGFLVGIVKMPTAQAAVKAAPTTKISVFAGKPIEFGFKLSKLEAPVGTVVFSVTNEGKVPHSFKVCTKPSPSGSANACVGKATKTLNPNQSAVLTVVFKSKGIFEYLCTIPGHASAGMKGRIGIGEVVPKTVTSTTTTQTTTATTTTTAAITKPPATEALIGNPTNGAAVFTSAGCGSCHTLAAAHSGGTAGPNLDSLAPGQSVVVTQVTNGGFNMPAFASTLSSTQINDLASYVYQSTHQ